MTLMMRTAEIRACEGGGEGEPHICFICCLFGGFFCIRMRMSVDVRGIGANSPCVSPSHEWAVNGE